MPYKAYLIIIMIIIILYVIETIYITFELTMEDKIETIALFGRTEVLDLLVYKDIPRYAREYIV